MQEKHLQLSVLCLGSACRCELEVCPRGVCPVPSDTSICPSSAYPPPVGVSCRCVLAVSAGSLPTPPAVRSLPRPPVWTSRHALHAEFAWMHDVGAWLLRRVSSKTKLPGFVYLVSPLSVVIVGVTLLFVSFRRPTAESASSPIRM